MNSKDKIGGSGYVGVNANNHTARKGSLPRTDNTTNNHTYNLQ